MEHTVSWCAVIRLLMFILTCSDVSITYFVDKNLTEKYENMTIYRIVFNLPVLQVNVRSVTRAEKTK